MWNTTCLTFFTKYLLRQHCCFARTWFRFLVTCRNVLQSCYNMPLLEGSIFIIKTLFLERYIANRKQTYWKNKVLMSNGGVGYGQAWNWLSYQDEYSKKSHRIALKEIFHKYNFYAYSYPYSRIQRIKRTTRSKMLIVFLIWVISIPWYSVVGIGSCVGKWQEQQRYWNNKGIKMASEAPGMSYFMFIYFLGGRISTVSGKA